MRLVVAAVAAALSFCALSASAQTWPSKPVKVVVPFGPGTATDAVARALTAELTKSLGQPFVVVNKGGADGAIGATEVARAAPDGYTLLVGSNSSIVVAPLMRKDAPYDTLKDFEPISFLGESTFFIAVPPSVPAQTLQEFVAYAKANPNKLNYATGNTTGIVSTQLLAKSAGIQMQHIPYKSDPEAMPDLLSGQVQFIIATYLNVGQHAKAGKLRLLATTLPQRSPLMPDVPSIVEAGQPEFPIGPWAAILGPAKLAPEIVKILNAESAKAMAKPEVLEVLMKQGFAPRTNSVAEFTTYLKGQVEAWRTALKDAGIEPQ